MLENLKVVDLTIPLGPQTIMWPGSQPPEAETVVTIAHDGYFARRVSFYEHTGTHFDAPCHFVNGATTVDKIPATSLVKPAIVIDISKRIGIDTLGIDSGGVTTFPVHATVSHPKGLWHLENLQNLKMLPPIRAWIVVGVLPLIDGSGSPARVFALVP